MSEPFMGATVGVCPACGKSVPQLVVSEGVMERVVYALETGSPTIAALEMKHALDCPEPEASAWVAHTLSCAGASPTSEQDEAVLGKLGAVFAEVPRPEHFTNFTHCDECREHDDTLRARTRDTLRRQDLGSAGWDPVSFCSEQGIGYLFPALARFAMLPSLWREHDWYGSQLLSHLAWEGAENRFLAWCSPAQRQAVAELLAHIRDTRAALIARYGCEKELAGAMRVWGEVQAGEG